MILNLRELVYYNYNYVKRHIGKSISPDKFRKYFFAVDCKWNDFGDWSVCSQDCGGGWQRRSRTVRQKAANGGMECNGCAAETKACNTHNCPRMLNIFCMLYYIISNK